MSYTYEELKEKNLTELHEIAEGMEHEAVKGHTQLKKEHLITAICEALNLDTHVHREVKGINKTALKNAIKKLKLKREKAKSDKKSKELKKIIDQIRKLKRKLRKATV